MSDDLTARRRAAQLGKAKRGRPITSANNFIENGYSPDDGLGPGQWVPRPGSAGVLDWRPAGRRGDVA